MNNISKTVVKVICIIVVLLCIVYAVVKFYDNSKNKEGVFKDTTGIGIEDASIELGSINVHNAWVGTFNLAWNEFMDNVIGGPIEFVDGKSSIAEALNKQNFTRNMLSDNSYYIETGNLNYSLRDKIEDNLKDKFNTESEVLDNIEWNNKENEYLIYAMLNKNFTFETPFPKLVDTFGDSSEKFNFFGLVASTENKTFEQVTVLFYNSASDFAVKIDTKEGEELILYRTDSVIRFDKSYNEIVKKTNSYTGRREMIREKDELKVPFINLETNINYDELCNRVIKGTNGAYIKQAVQTIKFGLDNYGGNIKSEAIIYTLMCMSMEEPRYFYFDDNFVLYLKEKAKDKPYFALKVDNTDVLVESL